MTKIKLQHRFSQYETDMYLVISIFIFWRIFLFLAAWLGEKMMSFSPRFPYADVYLIPSGLPHWLWSFANFDGVHYLTIATLGYAAQFTQVFFPLYPMLINLVHTLSNIDPLIIGLIISNIFFFFSIFIFSKLLSLDYKKETVIWTLLFLVLFPTSFYFGSMYTESLFFFLVLSSFLAARKKKWVLSAVLGAFAAGTRLTGIFLLPALWWEWKEKNIFRSPLPLIPVGLLSYMLYLQVKFGDFLYFWHAQPVFGAERTGSGIVLLPQVLWRYFKILTTVPVASETFWIPALEVTSTIVAILILIIGYFKKIRPSYLIFALLLVLTPTLTGTFSSMPRYVLLAFPIFMVLGMLKSRLVKITLLVFMALLLAVLTVLFTNGHWVS